MSWDGERFPGEANAKGKDSNKEASLWNREWQRHMTNKKKTKALQRALAKHLKLWTNRKQGELTQYMTQVLTGRGPFNSYLHKRQPTKETGDLDLGNIIRGIIQSGAKWHKFERSCHSVISRKGRRKG
ncbi:hypothetical protein RUM44_000125 [Polyplax serrata]|uniref:Uncharacterized protein n=1 Tax=Polyplax serrata TaxID=468196 RepID=A0ABR1B4J5_POLSC